MRRLVLAAILGIAGTTLAAAQELRPVIDVHIHYSQDAWGMLPQEGVRVEFQRRRHADAAEGRT